jgi:branched-chain amino acid transport system ATP-binding protein
MKMLEINNLQVNYGPVIAVKKVDFFINQGETVVLLGANGAGKTSTLLSIAGVANKLSGKVEFEGNDITKYSPEKILSLGIATVPENRDIFPDLSVEENLILGGYIQRKKPKVVQETINEVYELFPILLKRKQQVAGTLSGGEQQMLAIGRALMSKPKILLLDEPSLGLAPTIVEKIYEHIELLKKNTNLTILLVEQHAIKALSISDRVYFLRLGEIVSSGNASDLKEKIDFKKIYFGEQK